MSARTMVGSSTAAFRSSRETLHFSGAEHGLSRAFARTVARYLLEVVPQVRDERRRTDLKAASIPSPRLREVALQSLSKRGNIEGAALFATLAPPATRRSSVSALVAFQTAYNYLDSLSELPCAEPMQNARRLHEALLSALDADAASIDFYAYSPDGEDGGYLSDLLGACREALRALPSFAATAVATREAAVRIVGFQSLNLPEGAGGHESLERWARELPATSGLRWWEAAAGAGSSLAVHALIAATAQPGLQEDDARAVDAAYFPSTSALHSLLDSLVDRREDERGGRRCLLDYYDSAADSVSGLERLASNARAAVARLHDGHAHRVVVTAMCSYYLSAPEACTPEARAIGAGVANAMGAPLGVATAMFRSKRLLHKLKRLDYA